jgi:hypothetical protein
MGAALYEVLPFHAPNAYAYFVDDVDFPKNLSRLF